MNSVLQNLASRVQETQHFKLVHLTPFRSILAGAGICYAIEQDKLWHLPITFFFPSMYAGYQAYKHRGLVKKFITV